MKTKTARPQDARRARLTVKIATLAARHYSQLPYTHNWDGTYPFDRKRILGRSATDGFLLVQDRVTGDLSRVSTVAFWMFNVARLPAGGDPCPGRTASSVYDALPQIFAE